MKFIYQNLRDQERRFSSDDIKNAIARIDDIVFSILNKDELTTFIQNSQNTLNHLKTNNLQVGAIDEILYHFETFYSEYLDTSLPISDRSKRNLIKSFGEGFGLIESLIKELPSVLIEVIFPLFSLNKNKPITVHHYKYLKRFYPLAIRSLIREELMNDEDSWITFLTKCNFNNLPFTNYITEKIISETNQEDFFENQLDILLNYHKQYSQMYLELENPFAPHWPSTTKQVLNWLDIEIRHCRSKLKNKVANQSIIEFKTKAKFKTSLSVNKLLCLIKALKDSGILVEMSIKDIVRAIHDSFETIGSDDISEKSLYNKYNVLDNRTKKETKRILIEASKIIN